MLDHEECPRCGHRGTPWDIEDPEVVRYRCHNCENEGEIQRKLADVSPVRWKFGPTYMETSGIRSMHGELVVKAGKAPGGAWIRIDGKPEEILRMLTPRGRKHVEAVAGEYFLGRVASPEWYGE